MYRTSALLALTVSLSGTVYAAAEHAKISEYVAIDVDAPQIQKSPLKTVVSMRIPDSVESVGQAITYVLDRSGYSLVEAADSHPATLVLYKHSLPLVHRHWDFVTIENLLLTLAGPAYVMAQDPIHRTITFVPVVEYRNDAEQ